MEFLYAYLPAWALPYVAKITPQQWLIVGNVAAAALFVCGLLLFAYSILRFLGWRRYQGTWVSPDQFEAIVQELYSGVRAGRVPDYKTMQILDEYVYGRKGSNIRKMTKADHI